MSAIGVDLPKEEIRRFCQRWQIVELALFGSVLRNDFGQDSDVDVLVTFAPNANWYLLEHIRMEQELEDLLQRDVDLISRRAVERSDNWIRRREILNTAQILFSTRIN